MNNLPAGVSASYAMMAVVDTDLGVIHVFYDTSHHWVYNPGSDTYTEKTGGPNRAWRNLTYHNGIIYASGGQPANAVESGTVTCGKYTIATDTWVES